jgi:membrane protein DedA with SNARE-associated domain
MFDAGHELLHLLATYGYWAVLFCIAAESAGIPMPGETMLLAAAVYAGVTHNLNIGLIIAAALTGAVLGDNVGFLAGRQGGYLLLRRYGRYVGLDERRLKLGRYLFLRHGGKVVFWGRFIAVLRVWAAFLAGTHRMPWRRFLLYNMAGGAAWATLYGLGGYLLGSSELRLGGAVGGVTATLGLLVTIGSIVALRRNERRLSAEAEHALPGPLDATPTLGARHAVPADVAA